MSDSMVGKWVRVTAPYSPCPEMAGQVYQVISDGRYLFNEDAFLLFDVDAKIRVNVLRSDCHVLAQEPKFKVGDVVRCPDDAGYCGRQAGRAAVVKSIACYAGDDGGSYYYRLRGMPSDLFEESRLTALPKLTTRSGGQEWASGEIRVGDRVRILADVDSDRPWYGKVQEIERIREYRAGRFSAFFKSPVCGGDFTSLEHVGFDAPIDKIETAVELDPRNDVVPMDKNEPEPQEHITVSIPMTPVPQSSPSNPTADRLADLLKQTTERGDKREQDLLNEIGRLHADKERLRNRLAMSAKKNEALAKELNDKVVCIGKMAKSAKADIATANGEADYYEVVADTRAGELALAQAEMDVLREQRDNFRVLYESRRSATQKVGEALAGATLRAASAVGAGAGAVKNGALVAVKAPGKAASAAASAVKRDWQNTRVRRSLMAAAVVFMSMLLPMAGYEIMEHGRYEVEQRMMTVPAPANPNDPREKAWIEARNHQAALTLASKIHAPEISMTHLLPGD